MGKAIIHLWFLKLQTEYKMYMKTATKQYDTGVFSQNRIWNTNIRNEKRGEAQYIKKSETTTAVGIPDFLFVTLEMFYFALQTKLLSMAWAMTCILNRRFLHRRQLRQAVSLSSGRTKRMDFTWMSRQPLA